MILGQENLGSDVPVPVQAIVPKLDGWTKLDGSTKQDGWRKQGATVDVAQKRA